MNLPRYLSCGLRTGQDVLVGFRDEFMGASTCGVVMAGSVGSLDAPEGIAGGSMVTADEDLVFLQRITYRE